MLIPIAGSVWVPPADILHANKSEPACEQCITMIPYLIFGSSVSCSPLVHDGENVKRIVAKSPSNELDTNSTKHQDINEYIIRRIQEQNEIYACRAGPGAQPLGLASSNFDMISIPSLESDSLSLGQRVSRS